MSSSKSLDPSLSKKKMSRFFDISITVMLKILYGLEYMFVYEFLDLYRC